MHLIIVYLPSMLPSCNTLEFTAAFTTVEDGITAKMEGATTDSLRGVGDMLRDKDSLIVCVLASVSDGKISLAAACGKDAVAKGAHAGNILKVAAKICGGGGGGRPDSATAGGKDASKLDEALSSVEQTLAEIIK